MSERSCTERAGAARQRLKALREARRKLPSILEKVEQAEDATRTYARRNRRIRR